MQIVRTILWVLIAVVLMLFAFTNWTPVTINLWGGKVLDTWLPIVAFVSFLIGLVPVWLLHVATKWRMRRRLVSAERALASASSTSVIARPATSVVPVPSTSSAAVDTTAP